MSLEEPIGFERIGAVARVTLNRPSAKNALNLEMARALQKWSLELSQDTSVRAVILTGAGDAFCVGGDLRAVDAQGEEGAAYLTETAAALHIAISRMQRMDAPVITAVNGVAAGAGFSLALMGDYVMVSDRARMVSAYTQIGLTPDGSSTYFLARTIGLQRAKYLLLFNKSLSAQDMLNWGIASDLVAHDALPARATAMAEEIAQGPTLAYGETKRLLLNCFSDSLEGQMEQEARAIHRSLRTSDGRVGVGCFVQKKNASFEGR